MIRKALKSKKGEGYVDVAITVMIIAFVLVFAVNMVSLVALNQNIKTVSDQLVDYASLHGTTDIAEYATELKEKTGLDFSYTFYGSELHGSTKNVQLGDKVECSVAYNVSIAGFGEAIHFITIRASSSGISQVYWK